MLLLYANDYPPCNYVQHGHDGKSKQIPIPRTRKTPKVFPKKNNIGKRRECNAKRFTVSQVTRSLRYNVNPKVSGMDDLKSNLQPDQKGQTPRNRSSNHIRESESWASIGFGTMSGSNI